MSTVVPEIPEPADGSGVTVALSRRRGRGRGRGRGSAGRGRGRAREQRTARATINGRDTTQGWRTSQVIGQRLMLEDDFVSEVIGEGARLFCSSAMDRSEIERVVPQLEPTRAGNMVLFMDELLHTCMNWLNEYIDLQRRSMKPLTIYDLYRYVAILLMSHCTGLNFEKTIDIMQREGCKTPSPEEMKFISNHILAFSPTARRQDSGRT